MPIRLVFSLALLVACVHARAVNPVVVLANGEAVQLTDGMLASLQRKSVSATAHEKTATYAGYDLVAVLGAAGVEPVKSLRGKSLGAIVAVSAADGYKVVFALSELDPDLGNRQVLLVNDENGQPLPVKDGPWRLVVPSDKRPARWVRGVASIVISNP